MSAVAARLAELGIVLPPPPRALAAYVPVVVTDGWVFTAGQLPMVDGSLVARGLVGGDVSVAEAADAARIAALNALSAIAAAVGDLDSVERVVKVTGYVAGVEGFIEHPAVVNGASNLLVEVFGAAGVHARSAVGAASLPLGSPVEVEVVARVRDSGAGA